MSLNLSQILPQIERLGESAAERQRLRSDALPRASEGLVKAQEQGLEELLRKVAAAGDRWPGAAPSSEPVAAIYSAPPLPERLAVIGADGSQIYPDRHASAFYYLVNIGTICVSHGSQESPATTQQAALHSSAEELHDARGRPIQPAMVNLRRDVAEMEALADVALHTQSDQTVALLDNSLLLWMTLEADASARQEIDQHLARYLAALDRLRAADTAIAGFIDRPRNANTLALIHLASLALEQVSSQTIDANPYFGLTDLELFRSILPPGARSARFSYTSPLNRDFDDRGS